MSKNTLVGNLKKISTKSILLNITNLENGNYILKIVHKNKVLKIVKFNKK